MSKNEITRHSPLGSLAADVVDQYSSWPTWLVSQYDHLWRDLRDREVVGTAVAPVVALDYA